jgi:plasmid stabilization system protein ParE
MNYKLYISKDAHDDSSVITGYIAHELKNPQAAACFLDDVEKSYRRLAANHRFYSLCNDARLERMGYRKISIENYMILFRIDEVNKTVYIVRIVYGR